VRAIARQRGRDTGDQGRFIASLAYRFRVTPPRHHSCHVRSRDRDQPRHGLGHDSHAERHSFLIQINDSAGLPGDCLMPACSPLAGVWLGWRWAGDCSIPSALRLFATPRGPEPRHGSDGATVGVTRAMPSPRRARGCGGRAAKAELLTGLDGATSDGPICSRSTPGLRSCDRLFTGTFRSRAEPEVDCFILRWSP
jgi:hypothetical protein